MKNILLALMIGFSMPAAAQTGPLEFPTQAAAQAYITGPATLSSGVVAGGLDEWLYVNDPDWKIFKDWATSMGMGALVTWDHPHQHVIPGTPPQSPDPTKTQWYINIEQRVWAALTSAQQNMVTVGPQTNLLLTNYGSIMTDAFTGLRNY